MIFYHFVFDLNYFFAINLGLEGGFWFELVSDFVRASFLFLVGVSSKIVYLNAMSWLEYCKKQFKRISYVGLAAALISLMSYFFTEGFIFFGILHLITFSILLLVCLSRWYLMLGFLGLNLVLFWQTDFWPVILGITEYNGFSLDFFAVFPWIFYVLLGYFGFNIFKKLIAPIANYNLSFLSVLGRNSLMVYLLHQPVIIGLMYAVSFFI
jgi:uncharacterized membrane protein